MDHAWGSPGAGAVPHQTAPDRSDDGVVAGRRIEFGHARAGGRRAFHVRVGVEHSADLADADDERDQDGGDERELDGADALIVAMEHGFQHHWVLSAPLAVIRIVAK
jgi:hypothetical protein